MANKSTGALKYYAIDVNMRSALAEHGEACVGRCALLCLYCAEQVNGGIILDCGTWNARQWMIRVGLEGRPEDVPGLYHWEGDNLVVETYNKEAEEKALNHRRGGKKAAEARWGKKEDESGITECNDLSNTESNAKRIPQCNADSNADCITPGNAKERKGEERNIGRETTTVDSTRGKMFLHRLLSFPLPRGLGLLTIILQQIPGHGSSLWHVYRSILCGARRCQLPKNRG